MNILPWLWLLAKKNVGSGFSFDENLVGHWKLENNGDDELGDNHLISDGGAVLFGTGHVGDYSVSSSFGGSKLFKQNTTSDIKPANVTYSCWVKVNDGDGDYDWVMAHGDNAGLVVRDGTDVRFYIHSDTWNNGNWPGVQTAANVFDEAWHHIAGTYDGGDLILYVDGEEVMSVAETRTIGYTKGDDFYIGAMNGSRDFGGLIDDARIYDIALTGDQVFELYQRDAI